MWNLPTPKYVKEFEPQLHTTSSNTKGRSCSFDSQLSNCSEEEYINATGMTSMPKIIPISSHGSLSDSTISSSAASPRCASPASALSSSPVSPRSIFSKYWSTQNNNNGGESSNDFSASLVQNSRGGMKQVLLKDLESSHLNNDDVSSKQSPPILSMRSSSPTKTKGGAVTQTMTAVEQELSSKPKLPPPSIDDSIINYNTNKNNRPKSSRRQILPQYEAPSSKPTPPSYPSRHHGYPRRKWSSTTALLKRPTHSCIRPSRYSCSMIDERKLSSRPSSQDDVHHQDNSDDNATDTARIIATRASLPRSKSVSFYSQVSVFEFVNNTKGSEDARPSQDWSKYFA